MNISSLPYNGAIASQLLSLFKSNQNDGSNESAGSTLAQTPTISVTAAQNNATSQAIAAIQAIVKGEAGAKQTAASSASSPETLPDWYTATGNTTFTPVNSSKSVTLTTAAYDFLQSAGAPKNLDEVEQQFYADNTPDIINAAIQYSKDNGRDFAVPINTSLLTAIQNKTVKFTLLDSQISRDFSESVIGSGNNITGMTGNDYYDQQKFNEVYQTDTRNQYFMVGGNEFLDGYVISWDK
jgi:hypothetical protein